MSRAKPTLPPDPSPSPLPTPTSTNSFWHSQPSPLLTAHRTTRNLPTQADVVIIGSGMTGASVAHHLLADRNAVDDAARSGESAFNAAEGKARSVVMLEAREACWGATGRNGGHCQPLLLEHPDDPSIPAFELLNFRALHSLANLKQIDCEFVPQPGVRAIYSLANLHATELALHTLQSTVPEMAQLTRITRDEDELATLRVPGALGAVVTNVAARMWPYKFVARILEDLLKASDLPGGGFNLQTLTPVRALQRNSSGSGWDVTTDRGTINAKKVILATNAYTSHLLPSFRDLIVPVRGQMSALHPLPSVAGPHRLQTSFGFAGDGIDDYLVQRPNETGGHLMFGGGRQCLPCVGETDDSVIDDKTAAYLRRRLVDALALPAGLGERSTPPACNYCRHRKIRCSGPTGSARRCTNCVRFDKACDELPAAPSRRPVEFAASHEWTGIMGFSRDELPWVGPVPAWLLSLDSSSDSDLGAGDGASGLFMAAGFTGHGMPNCWLTGAAVARMVMGIVDPAAPPEAGAVQHAVACTGLPRAYLLSGERVARAREVEGVGVRDSMEMRRGEGGRQGVASGYA